VVLLLLLQYSPGDNGGTTQHRVVADNPTEVLIGCHLVCYLYPSAQYRSVIRYRIICELLIKSRNRYIHIFSMTNFIPVL
jgi:hypothetical protein